MAITFPLKTTRHEAVGPGSETPAKSSTSAATARRRACKSTPSALARWAPIEAVTRMLSPPRKCVDNDAAPCFTNAVRYVTGPRTARTVRNGSHVGDSWISHPVTDCGEYCSDLLTRGVCRCTTCPAGTDIETSYMNASQCAEIVGNILMMRVSPVT